MHLQQVYASNRVLDPKLQGSVCPEGGEVLWQVFNTLGRPVTQQEIAAWQTNHRVRLSSWEIDTLLAIDQVAAEVSKTHNTKRST